MCKSLTAIPSIALELQITKAEKLDVCSVSGGFSQSQSHILVRFDCGFQF